MAIFVIKVHWARSHHFDFRLEKDGVFKSWAVPKGLPESPGLKRLAVQVEDHALEFGPFHEANLEGESTKGRIQVWDHGTYEIEQWTDDRIAFTLHGSRVSGTFSLFRFKKSEPLELVFDQAPPGYAGQYPPSIQIEVLTSTTGSPLLIFDLFGFDLFV